MINLLISTHAYLWATNDAITNYLLVRPGLLRLQITRQ